MTGALPSKGYALKRSDGGSPEDFVKIAEITGLPGINRQKTMIEANSLDTEWDEVIPGIKKGGEITFNVIFRPDDSTGQAALDDDFDSDELVNFRIEATDSPPTTFAFAAYVSAINGPDGQTDNKLTGSITLRISGPVARL